MTTVVVRLVGATGDPVGIGAVELLGTGKGTVELAGGGRGEVGAVEIGAVTVETWRLLRQKSFTKAS